MRWYYGADGQTFGPVEDAALEKLELCGAIEWTTPIWREGMPCWKPLGEILGRPAVQCHECKRTVDKDKTVLYRGLAICPRCKEVFFQKVLEGTAREEAEEYCGFWIRVCARLLDGMCLAAVTVPLTAINQVLSLRMLAAARTGQAMANADIPQIGTYLTLEAGLILFSSALAFGYETFFVGRFGATAGKLLLGMRVVRADFTRVTYWRAAVRAFGKVLSDLTLYVGYIMVAFDPQRRALHDYIADTRVVKRDEENPLRRKPRKSDGA
ncbi:MAG TPA: RDD family protein [Chthoniobacterales bacterium]|nr:RDD family protein [Chthoniobacterales bacterium]